MKYFIANWKAYKNITEIREWIDTFLSAVNRDQQIPNLLKEKKITIILCPPYPFVTLLSQKITPSIFIGVQNISTYEEGCYTGETTIRSLVGLIDYTIIGHSERRNIFHESEKEIEKKVQLAKKYSAEPILCIRNERDKVYDGVGIVAYEPVYAIGSGNNEPLKNVLEMKKKVTREKKMIFLYGGSVTKDNCKEYIASEEIDGLLIGSASLDPLHFFSIILYGLEPG